MQDDINMVSVIFMMKLPDIDLTILPDVHSFKYEHIVNTAKWVHIQIQTHPKMNTSKTGHFQKWLHPNMNTIKFEHI